MPYKLDREEQQEDGHWVFRFVNPLDRTESLERVGDDSDRDRIVNVELLTREQVEEIGEPA